MNPSAAYPCLAFLNTLCERARDMSPGQLIDAGASARRILTHAWAREPRDSWLVIHALRCVCRTFASNPDESAALLRQAIESKHLALHGFEEMQWVTSEITTLIHAAPELVAEIYDAVLAHEEASD